MLPHSRAWKLLCKWYGQILHQEWARRLSERVSAPFFAGVNDRIREIWAQVTRLSAPLNRCVGDCCALVDSRPRPSLQLDPLEARVLLAGNSIATATLLPFVEDPAGSGLAIAAGNDKLDPSGDVDYFSFDVLAGDTINLRVEATGSGMNPYLELRNSADGVLQSDEDGGPGNNPLISTYAVAASGRLYARVSGSGTGDYQLRVERTQSIGLESDTAYSNNPISGANALTLGGAASALTSHMAGVIMSSEGSTADQDTYLIGYLKAGTTVNLGLTLPSTSTLNGRVSLLDASGNAITDSDSSDSTFSGTTTSAGIYYARVQAVSGAGVDAAYVLNVSVPDTVSPTVLDVPGLPASGVTTASQLWQTDVTVDEELNPASVTIDAFSLTNAGPDNTFGTGDDKAYTLAFRQAYTRGNTIQLVVLDGPLSDGLYRFQIGSSVTDVVGNTLDGSGIGAGGAFLRPFAVDLSPEDKTATFGGMGNDSMATATALPITADSATPELLFGHGIGVIYPAAYANWWSDNDWWKFTVQAGDKITLRTETPAGSSLDPMVGLYDSSGNEVASNDNSGPGTDGYINYYTATYTGTYYARVGKYYWSTVSGNYRLHADLVRGIDAETDLDYNNGSLGNADGMTLTQSGNTRTGSIAGLIMGNEGGTTDNDIYALGQLTSGNTVTLSLRKPSGSTLTGVVRLLDSLGHVIPDEDGTSGGEHYSATLTSTGTYYAQVYATSGAGPRAHYIMDVQVGDTIPPFVTGIGRIPEQRAGQTPYQDAVGPTNPLLFYKFDETTGTTVLDATAHGTNGTYVGTPILGAEGAYGAGHDAAVDFNASGYISVNGSQFDTRRQMSFSFWLWTDQYTNTWTPLIYKGTSGGTGSRTYSLWMNNNGYLQWNSSDGSLEYVESSSGSIRLKQWQHIAGVMDRDSGVLRLYIDGSLAASGGIRTNNTASNSNPLLIGWTQESSGSYSKLDGRIDDFAIYDQALPESVLLRPYRLSKGQGDEQSTDQLLGSFSVSFSEKLAATAGSQDGNLKSYNGHQYLWIGSQNWTSAQAWAISHGGHLATINDAAENEWLRATYAAPNGEFWINATDQVAEGTWLTADGSALPYTHWSGGQPDNGGGVEDYGVLWTNGYWNDLRSTDNRPAVVEFDDGTDTDADGLNDSYDQFPADPYNGYELREAGIDGVFGTSDDTLWTLRASFDGDRGVSLTVLNGPLDPGHYQFRVTPSLTDIMGNSLDGNADGSGGDAYVQQFTINPLPENVVFEGHNNESLATATPLTLVQDPTTPEYFFTQKAGFGSIDPAYSGNWWGGERLVEFQRSGRRQDQPSQYHSRRQFAGPDAGTV